MQISKAPRGRLLKVRDVFPARVQCQLQSFYNAVHSGAGELATLPHYKIGRHFFIAEDDLAAWLSARRVEPRGAAKEARG